MGSEKAETVKIEKERAKKDHLDIDKRDLRGLYEIPLHELVLEPKIQSFFLTILF